MILYPSCPGHEGRFMRRLGVDPDAAPAGVGRTYPRALGRPGVTVRAHYGALPSMAGRGRTKGGEIRPGRAAGLPPIPEVRSSRQKSPRWSAGRRFRGLWFPVFRGPCCGPYNQGAPFGAPPPLVGLRDGTTAKLGRSASRGRETVSEMSGLFETARLEPDAKTGARDGTRTRDLCRDRAAL